MDINRFAEHIASHGCVYKRSDIVAILTMSVDCMRKQLLAGQKIQLGDLGSFYISINSIGAASAKEFNPAIHIRRLNVNWTCSAFWRAAGGGGIQFGGNPKCSPCRGESPEGRKDYRRPDRSHWR